MEIYMLGWNGENLSPEQKMVLRSVAARHLRLGLDCREINFKHELCEGRITRGDDSVIGCLTGTAFHADLGTVNGMRCEYDFILPRHSEWLEVDDAVVLTRKGAGGGFEVITFDASASGVGDELPPGYRSRMMN